MKIDKKKGRSSARGLVTTVLLSSKKSLLKTRDGELRATLAEVRGLPEETIS